MLMHIITNGPDADSPKIGNIILVILVLIGTIAAIVIGVKSLNHMAKAKQQCEKAAQAKQNVHHNCTCTCTTDK